ncbi:MAG: hypothetical protein ACJARE_001902 [Paracoccaceae bacterium]
MGFAAAAVLALGAALVACVSKPDPIGAGDPRKAAAALGLSLRPVVAALQGADGLRLLSATELVSDQRAFGGFSGLELSADGSSMLAISDAGAWFAARLTRGGDRLTGIDALGWGPLHDPSGGVDLRSEFRDSEGLAALPDGGWIISFEGEHRLTRFASPYAPEETLRQFHEEDGFGRNSGLEALALRPDATLLAVRENGAAGDLVQQALILAPDGTTIRQIALPVPEGLRIVGADIDADGRLWTVQRGFSLLGGFFFALEVMDPDGGGYGTARRLGMVRGEGADNAEGLSVWRDGLGRVRLTAISDDNFFPLQRTILYEFVVERPDILTRVPADIPAQAR